MYLLRQTRILVPLRRLQRLQPLITSNDATVQHVNTGLLLSFVSLKTLLCLAACKHTKATPVTLRTRRQSKRATSQTARNDEEELKPIEEIIQPIRVPLPQASRSDVI